MIMRHSSLLCKTQHAGQQARAGYARVHGLLRTWSVKIDILKHRLFIGKRYQEQRCRTYVGPPYGRCRGGSRHTLCPGHSELEAYYWNIILL